MASFFDLLTTKQAFLDSGGNPLSGGRLWTKISGSNTNKTTFRDADGSVGNTNPIILDTRGELPFGIYGSTGAYRLILTTPGDLTDPPSSPVWGPRDNVSGINDVVVAASTEWNPTGLTPTFISSTSFSVAGDQTTIFEPRRRVRSTVGAGFRHSTIQSAVFTSLTTVTLVNDGTGLDGSLSAVAVGNITATNTSQPHDSVRGTDVASSGTLTLPANADRFNVTGTTTITAISNSWTGRRVFLTHASAQQLTHSATFSLPGGINLVTIAGDETIWEQTNSTPTWKLVSYLPSSAPESIMVLDREPSTISVVNTVSETVIASFLVPAGIMGTHRSILWRVIGNLINNSGATNNLTVRFRFGGTVFWQDFFTIGTNSTRRATVFDFMISNKNSAAVQSAGGTISLSGTTPATIGIGDAASTSGAAPATIASSNTDLTVNTAVAQTFEITVQWNTASANSGFERKHATLILY